MKTRFTSNQRAAIDGLIFVVLCAAILSWAFFVSGCATHQLPKDAAIIGGSQASTPWGHGEIKGVMLTGKAATPENVAAAAKALPDVLK